MSNTDTTTTAVGSGLGDLNSTQKGGVQALSRLSLGMLNSQPVPATAASPVATGINNLGATGTALIGTSFVRHGIIFHNPGFTDAYIYPTAIAAVPTTTALGGALLVPAGGGTLALPSLGFANVNCAWSGFSASGSNNPLTIVVFF